jgi:hypothetical protein
MGAHSLLCSAVAELGGICSARFAVLPVLRLGTGLPPASSPHCAELVQSIFHRACPRNFAIDMAREPQSAFHHLGESG